MFMVSIDYTVKETKQFDGGRDNSAVYTKITLNIIKLITWPFTSENLYVYDTVHILRTGAVVIHCTHRLHQIRLHLTSFIAACSFTAEELGVSEQLQWWRDANLFVSTLQRWSPVFFLFFFLKMRIKASRRDSWGLRWAELLPSAVEELPLVDRRGITPSGFILNKLVVLDASSSCNLFSYLNWYLVWR